MIGEKMKNQILIEAHVAGNRVIRLVRNRNKFVEGFNYRILSGYYKPKLDYSSNHKKIIGKEFIKGDDYIGIDRRFSDDLDGAISLFRKAIKTVRKKPFYMPYDKEVVNGTVNYTYVDPQFAKLFH